MGDTTFRFVEDEPAIVLDRAWADRGRHVCPGRGPCEHPGRAAASTSDHRLESMARSGRGFS